jgi:hypothetical protein
MRLLVSVKQVGRKKPFIGEREIEVPNVASLRELIAAVVHGGVLAYNARSADDALKDEERTLFSALSKEEIEDKATIGKVGFGQRRDARAQDPQSAVENALLSFEDGLYRVFVGDEELSELDATLSLREGDKLTFIRLTMLAGRLW